MTTLEGNKLIGFFKEGIMPNDISWLESRPDEYFENVLCYHKSWDLLMPVVEKLYDMDFDVSISHRWCCIDGDGYFGDSSGETRETTILTVWEQVVNCVQWLVWYPRDKKIPPLNPSILG